MLVLTRKCQEAVVVESDDQLECLVKVTVLDIRSGRVRLGFEAPGQFPVHRWEVWQRIRANGGSNPSAKRPAAPAA